MWMLWMVIFVPNITIGAPVVASLKTKLPLDCHLMIAEPERYIEDFVKPALPVLQFIRKACVHLHGLFNRSNHIKCAAVTLKSCNSAGNDYGSY